MTSREKRFIFIGLALGLTLAAVVYFATGSLQHAHAPGAPAANASVEPAPATATSATSESAPAAGASGEPGSVQLTEDEQKSIGLQTVEVTTRNLSRDLLAPGRVDEAETQLASISAWVGGRIEKLYVSYTGQAVRRGEPIAIIYSPDVLQSAQEYKLALENRQRMKAAVPSAIVGADEMVQASRRKLELWGLTEKQITDIGSSPQPKVDITIYSPANGIVAERKVTAGQYVKEGDLLYTLTDLSSVWVKADVYEIDLPSVQVGQAVEITSDALSSALHGRVQFIEPVLNPQTRTVAVRVQVANPGMRLRPGMFANVALRGHTPRPVPVVPRSAVVDSGQRKIVYVARGNGLFEGRAVELGPAAEDYYPVISGLKPGERVVSGGAFMIDSQTRLTTGMTGLFGGSKAFERDDKPAAAQASAPQVKITFRTTPSPPKGAAENAFHVIVTDAAGKPVSDAQVKVIFLMPAMPGMGEMRSSADLAWNGREYAGKGGIPMAGPYNVVVEVSRGGQPLASYRTRVNAE